MMEGLHSTHSHKAVSSMVRLTITPVPSIWPETIWPPRRVCNERARSRFTKLPGCSCAKDVRLSVSGITSTVKVALVFVFAAMISLPTREGALPDKEGTPTAWEGALPAKEEAPTAWEGALPAKEEVPTAWEGALPVKEGAPTAWEGAPEEDMDVTVRHTPLVAILSPTCVP